MDLRTPALRTSFSEILFRESQPANTIEYRNESIRILVLVKVGKGVGIQLKRAGQVTRV